MVEVTEMAVLTGAQIISLTDELIFFTQIFMQTHTQRPILMNLLSVVSDIPTLDLVETADGAKVAGTIVEEVGICVL